MDTLPKGWVLTTLDDITDINPRHSLHLNPKLPVSFIPMPAVSENSWQFQFVEERTLGEVRKGYTHFSEGDVLFAKITPCMENGKAAIAINLKNGAGCGSTEFHVLRPREGVLSKLVYHFVHQESFRREAASNFTGTAGQLRVPISFVRNYQFPLPPLPEQHRIIDKLEALLKQVNDCHKRMDKISILLKRFRKSVLVAACNGGILGDNSNEWEVTTLGNVLTGIQAGKSFTCEERPPERGETGVVKVSAVTWGVFDELASKTCVDQSRINSNYFIKKGDFLFSRANTIQLVGACVVVEKINKNLMLSDKILRFQFSDAAIPKWILFWLQSDYGRGEIERLSTGNQESMRNIGQNRIKQISLRLPPIKEQQIIVHRVEALFALADSIEARYTKGKTCIDKLTQSILAKAFRGELVSQDPNEEPASVLLEKIKIPAKSKPEQKRRRNKNA